MGVTLSTGTKMPRRKKAVFIELPRKKLSGRNNSTGEFIPPEKNSFLNFCDGGGKPSRL